MNAYDISQLSWAELNYFQFISTCKLYNQIPYHATLFDISPTRQGLSIIRQRISNPEFNSTKTIRLRKDDMIDLVHHLISDYPDLILVDTTTHDETANMEDN